MITVEDLFVIGSVKALADVIVETMANLYGLFRAVALRKRINAMFTAAW